MIFINGTQIPIEHYPDGTPRIKAENLDSRENSFIEWKYEPNEEMPFYFIARHFKEKYGSLGLIMPYLPYAREDFIKDRSRVFTLKYFCELINSIGFEFVELHDVHSPVALALLNKSYQIPNMVNKVIERNLGLQREKDIVFYPDEGAVKRYADKLNFPYAFGIKQRNWQNGDILRLDIIGDIPKEPFNVLIVDDICSYGTTFLKSAEKLKEMGADKIYLYVTHCENSILQGKLINSGLLERIYTTNSIFTGEHPLIEVIG